MNIFNYLRDLFGKKDVKCKNSEYCPIYLSYLGEYGKDSKEIKYCKNSNVQYCTKYNLINQTEWEKMNDDEKIKLVKDINLIKYIDKK